MKKTAILVLVLCFVFLIQFGFQPGKGQDDRSVNFSDNPPFGAFETPSDGANVSSSVAFTGWALDDTQIESVKIYLQQNSNLQFIGDATFVEGARPDVAAAYPDYPNNTRAGWGYMMLTNFLPGGGNGNYSFCAIARDTTGLEVSLGTKSITCDNAHAVKPFGAIDTPSAGETVSGTIVIQGWVLTPPPNKVPEDGTTIRILIDGKDVGKPHYNVYRQDIASLFPGYANSNGALAYFEVDTKKYTNGLHTLAWGVTDNAGHSDGVGSRFFTIFNEGNDGRIEKLDGVITVKFPVGSLSPSQPVHISKTSDSETDELFSDTAEIIYDVDKKLPYEVHINTGEVFPEKDIEVTLDIPNDFFTTLSTGSTFILFAQIYQDGGLAELDNFILLPSNYDSSSKKLTAVVSPWAFTNKRGVDEEYEVILTIGAIPGNETMDFKISEAPTLGNEGCGTGIICPLEIGCTVTHPFLEKRQSGLHYGIDLRTHPTEHLPVKAASGGTVIQVKIEKNQKKPAPVGKGWGLHVILRHDDGSTTIYAHLSTVSVSLGEKVTQGKQIGSSGGIKNSNGAGNSKSPHLHFEFIPAQKDIKLKENRIDPMPCIGYTPGITENSFVFNGAAYKFDENNCKINYVGTSSIQAICVEDSNYIMLLTFEASAIGVYDCCTPPLVSVSLSFMTYPNNIYAVNTGNIQVTTYDDVNGIIAGTFEGTGPDIYDPDPFKGFTLSGKFYAKKDY